MGMHYVLLFFVLQVPSGEKYPSIARHEPLCFSLGSKYCLPAHRVLYLVSLGLPNFLSELWMSGFRGYK